MSKIKNKKRIFVLINILILLILISILNIFGIFKSVVTANTIDNLLKKYSSTKGTYEEKIVNVYIKNNKFQEITYDKIKGRYTAESNYNRTVLYRCILFCMVCRSRYSRQ